MRRLGIGSITAWGVLASLGAAALPMIAPATVRAQALPEADLDAGAETYAAECRACHTVSIAPTLRGVADRPAASVASFSGYSDALKARKDLVWTAANLDAFLKAPTEFVPGTRMIKGVPDAQTRANVVAYIRSLPPPRE